MATPPDKAYLLDTFRRTTTPEFHDPISHHESYSLYRGVAYTLAVMADKVHRSTQARYYLPSSSQTSAPASSARFAECVARLTRSTIVTGGVRIIPGTMIIESMGRQYRNVDLVNFEENDPDTRVIECRFRCVVAGTVGNLDFLSVDESGLLDPSLYSIADQSQDRAGVKGKTLFVTSQLILQDTGYPDVFVDQDVGLYVRINDSGMPQNLGQVLQILRFQWTQIEEPVGSGLYPRRVHLDEFPRRIPAEVFTSIPGPVFVDHTEDAITEGGSFPLIDAPYAAGNALYVLASSDFRGLVIRFSVEGEGTWEGIWEFWDGASWIDAEEVDDSTSGLTISKVGERIVTWKKAKGLGGFVSPISGITWGAAYRFRLTVAPTVTTAPEASRISMFKWVQVAEDAYDPNLPSPGITWELLDFRQMGVSIKSLTAPTGGRDDDLHVLGDDRGVYQQSGESDDAFRNRVARLADVVSPNSISAMVDNHLYQYGSRGYVLDVQRVKDLQSGVAPAGGIDGFFLDEDALDNYSPEVTNSIARLASTSPIPSPPSGPATLDGVAVASNDVVLLKDQVDPVENGWWRVVLFGPWTRDPDAGYSGGTRASAWSTRIKDGDTNSDTTWYCSTPGGIDLIGSDPLEFKTVELYPESPWVLPLSAKEAYGHFFILLPYLGDGDFGIGVDEGPVIKVEDDYVGPSFEGFVDGAPTTANGTYSAIYANAEKMSAGGVEFTMIRTTLLNE